MSSDLDTILEKWFEAKEKVGKLESRIEKYKAEIGKLMNAKDVDKISGQKYSVVRRRNTKTYVSKESLPPEIWKEYATKTSYDSFTLSLKK